MSAPTCEAITPLASGRVCAWCHPGSDWAAGHGICDTHKREQLLELHLATRGGAEAHTQSPKET